ncbi:MAG: AcrR family transcriptional regulator [Bacteriovoracaceae bacterium]
MTKEKIISVAMKLFARNGFAGTSIREISSEAGTNLAAINYYFKSKEGLYQSCLKKISESTINLTKKSLTEAKSTNDIYNSLLSFTNEIFYFYIENPNLLLLSLQETEKRETSEFPNIENLFNSLTYYFCSLRKNNLIKNNYEPSVLASMFFGIINHAIRYDEQRKKKIGKNLKDNTEYRKLYSEHIVSVFHRGIINN